jgi:hypothetical protein
MRTGRIIFHKGKIIENVIGPVDFNNSIHLIQTRINPSVKPTVNLPLQATLILHYIVASYHFNQVKILITSITQIAQKLMMSEVSVKRHLKVLQDENKIQYQGENLIKVYSASL